MSWLVLSAAVLVAALARESIAQESAQPILSESERAELENERQRWLDQARDHLAKDEFKAAIAAAERILAIDRRLYGDVHPEVASSIARIARFHELQGDYPAAITAYTEALALRRQLFGDNHWRVTDARLWLEYAQLLSGLSAKDRADLERADELTFQASDLYRRGDERGALVAAQEALALRRRVLGEHHRDYALALNGLAGLYNSFGEARRAEPLFLQSLEITKRVLGTEHPDYAVTLNNLAMLYEDLGDFARAEPLYLQSLEIRKRALGERHSAYATALNNLAGLYESMGDYSRAEPLYLQAIEIDKEVLGEDHPDYAANLNNLGALYYSMNDYVRAETLYFQALAIRRKAFGERHPSYAASLNNLASLYRSAGQYDRAAELSNQALQIHRQTLGDRHPAYATNLNNLAMIYESMGDNARAETLYLDCLALTGRMLGTRHPSYAQTLNNLAVVYFAMADYKRAEQLFREALEIRRSVLGEKHPSYLETLNNLGLLHAAIGEFKTSEQLYLQVLQTEEEVYGGEHPRYAISLNNLATVCLSTDDYARAERLLKQALDVYERSLGKEHLRYASALNNLATVYSASGDFAQAERLHRQALQITEKLLGKDHPRYAVGLYNLALVLPATNQKEQAFASLQQVMEIEQRNVEDVMGITNEAVMRSYLMTVRDSLGVLLNLAADPQPPAHAVETALTWTLRRKSMLLDTLCSFREAQRLMRDDPIVREQVLHLRGLRQQLSDLALNPARAVDASRVQEQMDFLQNTAERIEAGLHRELSSESVELTSKQVDLSHVRERLPKGSVLIELMRVPKFDFQGVGPEGGWKPARYLAFVLTPDAEEPPKLVDLGDAEEVDQAVDDWRAAVIENADLIDGSVLRELLWEPLAEHVGGAHSIFISPDGELNRLPLEALTDEDDEHLIERFRFVYLSSGKDLLRTFGDSRQGSVIMADPTYNLGAEGRRDSAETLLAGLANTQVALRGSLSQDVRGMTWESLPGFAAESREVQQLLQGTRFAPVQEYVGDAALEEVFKSLPAPRILHLVTHGFFVPDQRLDHKDDLALGGESAEFGAARGLARLRGTENPLLRSGIVLAGANALGDQTGAAPQGDDGWVTAEEISQMDLSGTELVVLSACETGLGDVRTGDGVYGLRRAFFHAGARTLITSLFKVPDAATSLLMRRFYRNLCKKELSPLESLHEAKLFVLRGGEDPAVDEVPADAERRPPRDWAAFVLSGAPR